MSENIVVPEKKKRGRKKQSATNETKPVIPEEKPPPKKRGRKPKGGKIVTNTVISDNITQQEPNIILHLKCSLNDINNNFQKTFTYNPVVEAVQSYNFEKNDVNTFLINNTNNTTNNSSVSNDDTDDDIDTNKDDDIKNIWKKINSLKINLHKDNISDKRSCCFWCTYDFDSPPIFIPKNEFKDVYQVYGCFCSPQCGVAHLMNEKIDSSVKFERYQLMNHIYSKIYNYKKNIKPAPNPYYLLDKFYGNLTIKEYRQMFDNDQLLIIVDKPLTHVFPEMYEDNSDFILNQKTIPSSNTYKLKRNTASSKKSTVLDNFTANKN